MPEIQEVIENYVAAWNSNDSQARTTTMNGVLAPDCIYLDSHLPDPTVGKESHCLFIDRFKDKFPDLSLHLTKAVDSHHDHFRFQWQMLKGDGDVFIKGCFVGEVNEQQQITKLVGFVDS